MLPWERACGITQGPPVCGRVHVCAAEPVGPTSVWASARVCSRTCGCAQAACIVPALPHPALCPQPWALPSPAPSCFESSAMGSPSALSPASFMCFCLPLSAPIVPSLQPPCADPFHPALCVCSHPHLAPPDVLLCHLISHQHHAHCSQGSSTLLWYRHSYSGPMSQSTFHRTTGTGDDPQKRKKGLLSSKLG